MGLVVAAFVTGALLTTGCTSSATKSSTVLSSDKGKATTEVKEKGGDMPPKDKTPPEDKPK